MYVYHVLIVLCCVRRSLELSMQIQGLGDILSSMGAASKNDKFSILSGTIQLINSLEHQCRQTSGFSCLEGRRIHRIRGPRCECSWYLWCD
jgi:hypothetical protein